MKNNFQQVVDNINTLMMFWRISIKDLADKSGLTVNGLKHMFENGRFKFDSLNKIANVFNIPIVLLLSGKIDVWIEKSDKDGNDMIAIEWDALLSDIRTTKIGKKEYKVIIKRTDFEITFWKKRYDRLDKLYQELTPKYAALEIELADKREILDYVKNENISVYTTLIKMICKINQGNEVILRSIDQQTKAKIFDESFLKTLINNHLINPSEYKFMTSLKEQITVVESEKQVGNDKGKPSYS